MLIYKYTTEDEKNQLIQQHSDKRVIEIANITDGNFIAFDDINREQLLLSDLKQRISDEITLELIQRGVI